MFVPEPAQVVDGCGGVAASDESRRLQDTSRRRVRSGGKAEERGTDGVDAPGFGRHKESGCGRSYGGNGKNDYLREVDTVVLSLPKHDGNVPNKKSVKRLSSFTCSKRPRIDHQAGNSLNAGTHDDETTSKEPGPDWIHRMSSEKSRLLKQKRGLDGKRADKRNFRTSVRAKYDCFASKSGLANCDSPFGGNGVLGMCNFKADLNDITKNMEDLSLGKLLDGSYRYSRMCLDKGKRAVNINENILVSVRKVWSILSLPGEVDSPCNSKDVACLFSPNASLGNMPDWDNREKDSNEKISSRKDSPQVNFSNSDLYQPAHVLDRLALPPHQNLDSLLSSLSSNSSPFQSTTNNTTSNGASLPPFPWSYCHGGAHKPSLDAGKLALTRSCSQGRWIRIGSNSLSIREDQSSFSELDFKKLEQGEDSSARQKIAFPEAFLSDSNNLMDGDCSNSQLKSCDNVNSFLGSLKLEVSLNVQEDDPSDLVKRTMQNNYFGAVKKEQLAESKHDCSCNSSCPSESVVGVSQQSMWPLPAAKILPGNSPRALHAADILWEMANCSNSTKSQKHDGGE
uniref:Uncharacterized protein n=1 Tax=Ananas comosus var. bracteatus TaxID=296719 RepID=A0A6V7QK67_ANACO|nr:unnamed protein product [Ananas comosus var. bracteatus]